jgi:hypothetical protein
MTNRGMAIRIAAGGFGRVFILLAAPSLSVIITKIAVRWFEDYRFGNKSNPPM